MRRGDVVTVAASGDYGKPRPAVIIQTDSFPADSSSVIVCQMTSVLSDAPDFRITIEPAAMNGLRERSEIMADKPVTLRRERLGKALGRLNQAEIARLDAALAFVMGLGG